MWGGNFEDEFSPKARFDRPYNLAMANAGEVGSTIGRCVVEPPTGPGTNGSQFFITTVPCPWLNDKHT